MKALTGGQQQGAGGGEYRMVSENVWASINHTGVLLEITQTAGRCWGGVNRVRHV